MGFRQILGLKQQLSNNTEIILIAPKKLLDSDSVPQSIKLESCDIKFANTVHNLAVSRDPTLSFQQQIYFVIYIVSVICHYFSQSLRLSPRNCCVHLFFQLYCPKYLLSKL